jgi:hypothetical protein
MVPRAGCFFLHHDYMSFILGMWDVKIPLLRFSKK